MSFIPEPHAMVHGLADTLSASAGYAAGFAIGSYVGGPTGATWGGRIGAKIAPTIIEAVALAIAGSAGPYMSPVGPSQTAGPSGSFLHSSQGSRTVARAFSRGHYMVFDDELPYL